MTIELEISVEISDMSLPNFLNSGELKLSEHFTSEKQVQ